MAIPSLAPKEALVMSDASLQVAGILIVLIPTVGIGGYSLLFHITRRIPGYLDNPTRRAFFIAGHAHAGVWIILALVALRYVDGADLGDGWKSLVRSTLAFGPLVMSAGFFLSMASPKATEPNQLIILLYIGAILLVIGTLTLGVGLIRAS
jgi:hypothetical protein